MKVFVFLCLNEQGSWEKTLSGGTALCEWVIHCVPKHQLIIFEIRKNSRTVFMVPLIKSKVFIITFVNFSCHKNYLFG